MPYRDGRLLSVGPAELQGDSRDLLPPSHFHSHPVEQVCRPGGLALHLHVRGIYKWEFSESHKRADWLIGVRVWTPAMSSLTHSRAVHVLGFRWMFRGCGVE